MTYQATFNEKGKVSAVPTKLGEHPQLEKQASLFTHQETEARKKNWLDSNKKEK